MAFFKKMLGRGSSEDEYLEIDLDSAEPKEKKIIVKPFTLTDYEETNEILNTLREGYTIAIIDIKSLKSKDIIELKRSISKIKKTVDALEGTIAGFGENTIIATPSFAEIQKAEAKPKTKTDFLT